MQKEVFPKKRRRLQCQLLQAGTSRCPQPRPATLRQINQWQLDATWWVGVLRPAQLSQGLAAGAAESPGYSDHSCAYPPVDRGREKKLSVRCGSPALARA